MFYENYFFLSSQVFVIPATVDSNAVQAASASFLFAVIAEDVVVETPAAVTLQSQDQSFLQEDKDATKATAAMNVNTFFISVIINMIMLTGANLTRILKEPKLNLIWLKYF